MAHDVIDFEDELRELLQARANSLAVADPPPIDAVTFARPAPTRVSRHRVPLLVVAAVAAVALLVVAAVLFTSEDGEVVTTDNAGETVEGDGNATPESAPEPVMVPVEDAPLVGDGYPLVEQIFPTPPCSDLLPFSYTLLPEGFGSQLLGWDPVENVLDEAGLVLPPEGYDFSVVHVAAGPDRHIAMTRAGVGGGSPTEVADPVLTVTLEGVDYFLRGVGVTEAELAAFGEGLVVCEQSAPATATRPGS